MKSSNLEQSSLRQGIQRTRRCRDPIFILVFVAYWIGMFVVCALAVNSGDIKRLVIPRDYLGNYCGINNNNGVYSDNSAKPMLYYIDPFNMDGINATFICTASCPTTTALVSNISTAPCRYDSQTFDPLVFIANVQYDVCSPYQYASTAQTYRCVPSDTIPPSLYSTTAYANTTIFVQASSFLTTGRDAATSIVADLYVTWPVLVVCAFSAVLVSLGVAKYAVGPFVWLSIILVNLVFIAGSIIVGLFWNSLRTAQSNGSSTASFTVGTSGFTSTTAPVTAWEVSLAGILFIVVVIVTVLFLLVTLAMVRRIKMAIEIINEASIAFLKLPGITFVPLGFSVPILLLFLYFVYILLYLMTPTSGVINNGLVGFHIFGVIWAFFTIQGMSHLTVAGAVAEWYWSMDKKSFRMPVRNSFYRAFRYSFGSVILGSLLITIVEFIRLALYNLQLHIAKSKIPYIKYIVACAQCCVKCLEVIIKWINRNAYVYIAITGKAFFAAAGCATSLLLRNASKSIAVTYVADAALILAKLAIVGINCISAFLFLNYAPSALSTTVSNPILTIILVGVITFMVSSLYLSCYQLAIDTIFLSVLEDMDKNDGSIAKPYFMTESMQKIMHMNNPKIGQF